MRLEARDFLGKVTFITGPGKACGKTTLLKSCLALLRAEGEACAFLGVGFEGEGRDLLSGAGRPRLTARAGEVFVTALPYLAASTCLPEVLEVLPGSTALGRLAVARAGRAGSVTLVGPERNEYAALAVSHILEEGWSRTVFVDGAMNRITQVAAFPGAGFLFSLKVTAQDLARQVSSIRLLDSLLSLPVVPGGEGQVPPGSGAGILALDGPLTAATAQALPATAKAVSVADFTKVFLDLPSLRVFLREKGLYLRRRIDALGYSVVLRGISREAFLEALGSGGPGSEALESRIAFNAHELELGAGVGA